VKHSIAAPKGLWLKTTFANLIRDVPSGIYFSRIQVRGKLIRRSFKTTSLTVAKLRLGDLEKVGVPPPSHVVPIVRILKNLPVNGDFGGEHKKQDRG
jgi:hypothetical protein